jgi:hypothetical protein
VFQKQAHTTEHFRPVALAVTRALALIKVAVETLKKLFAQTRDWKALVLCPIKKMFRRSDVPAGGYLGVAPLA